MHRFLALLADTMWANSASLASFYGFHDPSAFSIQKRAKSTSVYTAKAKAKKAQSTSSSSPTKGRAKDVLEPPKTPQSVDSEDTISELTTVNTNASIDTTGTDSTSTSSPEQQHPRPRAKDDSFVLEPALDGPPSTETIRQLARQMKRASHMQGRQGHRAGPSVASMSSFQMELDQALENIDLVRQKSNASVDSGKTLPPLPTDAESSSLVEGIQSLGKSVFHRRTLSKQGGTSSSASSIYSNESPIDTPPSGKESLMNTLFSRRKPSRDESQRRYQISGPFNFQHVAQTTKTSVNVQQTDAPEPRISRRRAPSDLSSYPTPELSVMTNPPTSKSSNPLAGMRRLMKSGRATEVNEQQSRRSNSPPPRPPRSPMAFGELANMSLQDEGDQLPQRPRTSGGIKHAYTFDASTAAEHMPPLIPRPSSQHRSNAMLPASPLFNNEPAWPLASPTITSFGVLTQEGPQMEDQLSRQRRLSQMPTTQLRLSQSVPMLRALLESHQSNSSLPNLSAEAAPSPNVNRESWEEDIDYCYEHEAEADCDYRWERPSLDNTREQDHHQSINTVLSRPQLQTRFSSSGSLSVPSLSPSQLSPNTPHDALTPSMSSLTREFTLPPHRAKSLRPLPLKEPTSPVSAVVEHHDVSPTLLVPREYRFDPIEEVENDVHYDNMQRISNGTSGSSASWYSSAGGDRHVSTHSNATALTQHTLSSVSLSKMASSWTEVAEEATIPEEGSPAANPKISHKPHASESVIPGAEVDRPTRMRARTTSMSTRVSLFPKVPATPVVSP